MPRMAVDQRSRQIVEAAAVVIVRDGLAKATTRRIADEAGVPLGILHYAFRDKQDLLAAVFDHWIASVADAFADVPDGLDLTATTRALAHAVLDWVIADHHLAVAQYELLLWARRSHDTAFATRLYDHYEELFADTLHRSGAAPDAVARHVDRAMVAVDGVAIRLLSRGDAADARRALDAMFATL